jgi:iron(III) transport system permease protein
MPLAFPVARPPRGATLTRARRRSLARSRRVLGGLALCAVVALFTTAPMIWVLVHSFNANNPGEPYAFSLDGWSAVFSDPRTLSSIGYSFLLSIRIPIAITVAVAIAWALVRMDLPARRLIESSLWLAFFLPSLPVTLGWILLADGHYGLINKALDALPFVSGPVLSINSVAGIIWVHLSLSTIPIMVILLTPALRQFDAAYEEASAASGAGVLASLWRVTLPLLRPAILVAALAGFIKSLEVFEIEQILGTPVGIYVYSTRIFDLVTTQPPLYAQAFALGSLFLVVILAVGVGYQLLLRRWGAHATVTGRGVSFRRRTRTRWSWVVSGLILAYLAVGVFLPVAVLVLGSFTKLFGFFFIAHPWTTEHWSEVLSNSEFGTALRNSLLIGVGAGVLGTLVYALLAWTLVRTRVWGKAVISILVWLPWAVPGVLAGVAWLSIFLTVPGPSSLYGTLAPLAIVLVISVLPLGTQMLRSSIEQVSGELEEAATVSGSSFVSTFRRITLPLIAPMLVSVFMVVVMATMRDISTVVLLAQPGTRTLPLLMFSYANAGRYESAAVIGVIMAIGAMGIVWVARRAGLRLNPGQAA